jgi:flagellar M-ring protein FliF
MPRPVVQKLKESGVEYRLTDGGSVVLVPSARLAESRLTLAAAGLPKSGRIGFELFDKTNFGATELVEHINHQRALEGELERSVLSMAEVVQARVHLTFPRESVFLDQQQPAKASVMIKLSPARASPRRT